MRKVILIPIIAGFLSCSQLKNSSFIFDYFPESNDVKKGVVNKYYDHFYPEQRNRAARTNISYSLTRRNSKNSFSVEWYNAGFELTEVNFFHIQDGKVLMDSSVSFYGMARLDTAFSEIRSPVFEDWNRSEAEENLIKFIDFNGSQYEIARKQTKVVDSVILAKPAKVFIGERTVRSMDDGTENNNQYAAVYVQGLGLYRLLSTRSNGRSVTELVEQMPLAKFNELRNHSKTRVAYIDPVRTMDDNSYFKLCGHEKAIADYYNSSPDVRFSEGKGVMKNIIRDQLEREKLKGESGYLTFRFVVNCKGEAGRFVLEQSGLDYQKKQFPQETIDHLYQITYHLKEWQPGVIRDEPRDAYVYVTYKLQNGVVTDVLP